MVSEFLLAVRAVSRRETDATSRPRVGVGSSYVSRSQRRVSDGSAVLSRLGLQAVVLGTGMAGLLAAGVLSEFYESVTVVEG